MPPLLALPFPAIDPVALAIGPITIKWYALAYIAGLIGGWYYARRLVMADSLWGVVKRPQVVDIDVAVAVALHHHHAHAAQLRGGRIGADREEQRGRGDAVGHAQGAVDDLGQEADEQEQQEPAEDEEQDQRQAEAARREGGREHGHAVP